MVAGGGLGREERKGWFAWPKWISGSQYRGRFIAGRLDDIVATAAVALVRLGLTHRVGHAGSPYCCVRDSRDLH